MRFNNVNSFAPLFVALCLQIVVVAPLTSAEVPETLNPRITPKIIGGVDAAPGAWPYITALINTGSDPFSGQFCGAVLIDPEWVVTAAHCVPGKAPADIEVLVGAYDLSNTDGDGGGERRAVSQIISHPNYNDTTNDSDIALLKLAVSSSKTPVSLPTESAISSLITGVSATVIGWGTMTSGADDFPSILQQVDVPVVSAADCDTAYGGGITSNMLCAGFTAGGKDSCQGDSGGPLLFQDNATFYNVGVVSFGNGCALANTPGVYARVSEYLTFIETNTGATPEEPVTCTDGLAADAAPTLPTPDADGDGVSDADEITAGTDQNDPGSLPSSLNGRAYAFWSGFLEMENVLEVINISNTSSSVTIKLHTIDGTPCHQVETFSLAAGAQRDVIISALPGYTTNSHGVLSVSYTGGEIDGRTSYYRRTTDSSPTEYDFAYSLPLSRAAFGPSAVSFNTNQPSRNPSESGNQVPNWLTIINLSDSAKTYSVETFDISGNSVGDARTVSVGARQRADIDGGHVTVGDGQLGIQKITPSDAAAPYIAFLIRFGGNVAAGQPVTAYSFATALSAKAGNGRAMLVPLTTTVNAENWLEIINTLGSATSITVAIYDNTGTLAAGYPQTVSLAAYGQSHIPIHSVLGTDKVGVAKITPSAANSIIAQSMVYIRDTDGSIKTAYGSQSREAFASSISGTYNLFLGMENWLKLLNPSAIDITAQVMLTLSGGGTFMQNYVVPANGSVDLGLHDTATYSTSADTVGVVTIDAGANTLISELLRLRRESGSFAIDYAFPTPAR